MSNYISNETASLERMHNFYNRKENSPLYQEEFGFYSLDRWKKEGHIDDSTDLRALFGFDRPVKHNLNQLGWCEAAFSPCFETIVLEDRGDYELVQDYAGRHVLFFKGRRSGFMPEYVNHPVKDMKTWEDNVKWRLDFNSPERFSSWEKTKETVLNRVDRGFIICNKIIGGYMYLRSLIGPEDLLYKFYDEPELIHSCMQTWLELADRVSEKLQEFVTFDEVFLAEDICYKSGPLISPDMIREFLFPYYQQLIINTRSRQADKSRVLHIQIDTDGNAIPVIDVYKEIGMDFMSPFEVASDCDVVEVRKQFPDLLIRGGIDKRILAQGKEAIDKELLRIIPFMKKYGGFIPTCDHGVPEEVSFDNYMHYRKRMLELSL
jgi:uroporphyrinogen decarboxylase